MIRKIVSRIAAVFTALVMWFGMLPVAVSAACAPPVYVYVMITDDGEQLSYQQLAQLRKAGLQINQHGYFTIGKISSVSGLPKPGSFGYWIGSGNKWNNLKKYFLDKNNQLVHAIERHTCNHAIAIDRLDWTAKEVKLLVCYGATDYPEAKLDPTWHLDGTADIDDLTASYATEHYVENLDGTGYTLADTTTKSVQLGKNVTAESLSMDGFTFDADNPKNVVSGTVTASDQLVLKCYYTRNRNYTVTWKNEDGSVLKTDTNVAYEAMPVYDTAAEGCPTKDGTPQYNYVFSGWSPELQPVKKNITYTAVYQQVTNRYTVTWVNWDDTILEEDEAAYGETPGYEGAEPTRPADSAYTYTFQGWEPEVSAVKGNVTYRAVFTKTPRTYPAAVQVLLNGSYDSETDTASGEPVSMDAMMGKGTGLYVQNVSGGDHIVLQTGESTGMYTADLPAGTYQFCISSDGETFTMLKNQQMIVNGSSRTQYLFFSSVTYDADGGSGGPDTAYYENSSAVTVSVQQPEKEGFLFKGWKEDDKVFQPGDTLTDCIGEEHTLTAQWAEAVDVKVNVTVNHRAGDDCDQTENRENVSFSLWSKNEDSTDYEKVGNMSLTGEETDPELYAYSYDTVADSSIYTAQAAAFSDLDGSCSFTVEANKSEYDVTNVQVTKTGNEVVIDVTLQYAPGKFDLQFQVETKDGTPTELLPKAVHVKVLSYDETKGEWYLLPQHENSAPLQVELDAEGKGSGSCSVKNLNP
ncbi:InlB B-repeat-containing protein [uncultured Ruminococcus sp.]|uniref:InlB B-repeat-containing protein n=1 Tax=uncultured Ruminococcus sp. TaxID=165186 RepID=UPI00260471B1|nr:InlB B-repeat-containing protein [uncultured Ruminococcus sp.]